MTRIDFIDNIGNPICTAEFPDEQIAIASVYNACKYELFPLAHFVHMNGLDMVERNDKGQWITAISRYPLTRGRVE